MPANLTPEYRRAETLLREATTNEEKISALELMLQTIPKHKGTDHMQADIKRRLAKLRQAPAGPSGKRQADIFHVPCSAAGQVVLLGTPNSGKSALVAALTNAHVQVADFPFSTHSPVPGIMQYEDVQIQLVDMPPITPDHVEPGQIGAYRQADLILLVVDLSAADVTEQMQICIDFLEERTLIRPADIQADDRFFKRMVRPCLGVAAKSDLASADDLAVLREMFRSKTDSIDLLSVSAIEQESLDRLARRIFEELRLVRIYSKLPGKEPDMNEPFTLSAGATVNDLARKVHRELADKLRYARIWGQDKFPGQQIPRNYQLNDKDIIELHFA